MCITGLGLSFTQDIILVHDGILTGEGEWLRKGCRVIIKLQRYSRNSKEAISGSDKVVRKSITESEDSQSRFLGDNIAMYNFCKKTIKTYKNV